MVREIPPGVSAPGGSEHPAVEPPGDQVAETACAVETLPARPVCACAREIGDSLAARGIKLSLGGQVYDPADPMGKMFFNILATFAEFEVDLLRARTREGMAVAKARGKLRGKQPKLTSKQQRELVRMCGTGEYTIADLAEVFTVSRTTIYRTLQRDSRS